MLRNSRGSPSTETLGTFYGSLSGWLIAAPGRPARASKGGLIMYEYIGTVKRQIAWFNSQIARYDPEHPRYRPEQIAMYERLVREFSDLLRFLETLHLTPEIKPAESQIRPNGADQISPSPGRSDLADLPEELLNELSGKTTKGDTDPLLRIIEDRGGTASLDDILIDFYRKYGQIGKRILIQNKLYRLSKHGLVSAIPGKKGIYTTKSSN
jgi:hypothetical protein